MNVSQPIISVLRVCMCGSVCVCVCVWDLCVRMIVDRVLVMCAAYCVWRRKSRYSQLAGCECMRDTNSFGVKKRFHFKLHFVRSLCATLMPIWDITSASKCCACHTHGHGLGHHPHSAQQRADTRTPSIRWRWWRKWNGKKTKKKKRVVKYTWAVCVCAVRCARPNYNIKMFENERQFNFILKRIKRLSVQRMGCSDDAVCCAVFLRFHFAPFAAYTF